ncbi:hypothetical protein [Pseudomonas fluorescens]|uniref:YbjN domain-containing protein n=1 Tax=Pseudomonas fluorescens TaxID=294 RepID=A0A944DMD4_PSEFL|nr:hypothetical protein [Pseudomonas fluorescens]MBT2295715.1 hypothetical protein [Pseudomonas fluorescens]MBT2305972.1 hypothetical protein [Pseudomonas fluorescens]MBT2314671.1 hypothetical protein [Pseudomonas fluorescens]MBT2315580.1 hypothetical protein [Pseudomonas fluorescens]MBT2331417.1 hypothetical protein [Pseudomonas fluorescens]
MSIKKKKFRSLLASLNYDIDEVEDGVIYFKSENFIYRLIFEGGNNGFVGFGFSVAIDEVDNNVGQQEVERYINSTYKIMKCFYDDAGLVLSCEGFAINDEEFIRLAKFSVASMSYAYAELCEKFPSAV